ncbi:MAG: hypothetical protein A2Y17_03185 [Clostridiales bacterium GWF2_38_85]|nr:MAG: hypothetical protein A2Y17_03185 [Clostridiales bacterium GWF2_38_85]
MIKKITNFIKRNFALIIVLTAVLGLIILPLSIIQVPKGHDIYFHMERIESLSLEMKDGNLFPRIYTTALNDYGYASPMFYGDLLLRIPALLVITGVSVPVAYKIFLMLIALFSVVISYFCFNSIVKNKTAAGVGAILFSLSSYFATDLFSRAAIGEAQIFIFLPVAFLGYYHIMFGDHKKWFYLPLGLFFMLQCHMLSAVIFVVLLAIFTLFYLDIIIKTPKKLLYIGVSVFVFIILSAYFLIPMLEQFSSTTFIATDGTAAIKWGTLSKRSMPWWSVFCDFNYSIKTDEWIPNGVGFIIIAVWTVYFIIRKKFKSDISLFSIILSTILLFMTTEFFPWKYFQNTCGVMQFPWRLLVFAVFFMTIGAIYLVKNTSNKNRIIVSLIFIIISLLSFMMTVNGKYSIMLEKASNNEVEPYPYNNNVGAYEYFPTGTNSSEVYSFTEIIRTNNNDIVASYNRSHGKIEVEFSGNDYFDTYIELPLIMYKGYSAITPEGENLEVIFGDNNRVRIMLGDLQQGTFIVEYTGTVLQKASDIISVIGFIIFFIFIIIILMRNRVINVNKLDSDSPMII